jgi:hypothetical protein
VGLGWGGHAGAMNRMRLIAAALVVAVLAVVGVFAVWQRSEASGPRLGGAIVVKPTPRRRPRRPTPPAQRVLPCRSVGRQERLAGTDSR